MKQQEVSFSLQCRCVSTHMPFNLSESQLESHDSLTISYMYTQKYYFYSTDVRDVVAVNPQS